ncbi:hypothetical protein KY285_000894 [Solanum tuberosum]|nr:hypothetical protein KY285_000894 [Solanum tuberosum]
MVNAQELEVQRQRLGLEAETVARGVEQIDPPHRQPLAPRGQAQQPTHMAFEEDDLDLDGAGATGAIALHEIPGVSQTVMRLRLFPFSLTREATNWLNEMSDDSVRPGMN